MLVLHNKDFTTKYGTINSVIEAFVEEERNGLFELSFVMLNTDSLFQYIKEDNIVVANANNALVNQKFRIYMTRKLMNNRVEVFARHISFDLMYDYIDNISFENQSCEYALNSLFRSSQFSTHYRGYSDIINAQNYNMSMANVLEAIGGKKGSIIDTFGTGAELLRDNENIHILNKRGYDNSVTIEYRKNLTGFELEEDTTELVTRILPYAKYTPTDEEGNSLDEVTIKGSFVDSPLLANYSHPFVKAIDYSDRFEEGEEVTTSKLISFAQNEYKTNKVDIPKQNFKIEFIPLSKCVGYEGLKDNISLCDTVTIKDTRYNIDTQAKVIKTTFNVLKNRYESMELGEPKTSLGDIIGNNDSTKGEKGDKGDKGDKGEDGNIGDFPDSLPSTPVVSTMVYGFANIEISWTFENKVYYQYEVYASKKADFTPNTFNLIHSGQTSTYMYQAKPNETWYFKVCAVNTHNNRTGFGSAYATTVKIDDLSNYVEEMAINDALIGTLSLDRGWVGVLKGNYIDAKQLSVTDGNGKRTLDIDSFGNVNINATTVNMSAGNLVDEVNDLHSEMEMNNNSIRLQVSEVNKKVDNLDSEVEGKVSDLYSEIEMNASGIRLEVSEVNKKVNNLDLKVNKKVSELHSEIELNSNSIRLEVSEVDEKVDSLGSEVDKKFSDITIKEDGIISRVESVETLSKTNFYNLIINSNFSKGNEGWRFYPNNNHFISSTSSSPLLEDKRTIKIGDNDKLASTVYYMDSQKFIVAEGEKLTLSLYALRKVKNKNFTAQVFFTDNTKDITEDNSYNASSQTIDFSSINADIWKKGEMTVTVPKDVTRGFVRIRMSTEDRKSLNEGDCRVQVSSIMLAKGEVPVSWVGNTEDSFYYHESRLASAEQKITDEAITSTVKQNFYTKDYIDSKNYQSSSQVEQTVDSLKVKFEASGGYNNLLNSGFKKGLEYWSVNLYGTASSKSIYTATDSDSKVLQNTNALVIEATKLTDRYGVHQTVKVKTGGTYSISALSSGVRNASQRIFIRRKDTGEIILDITSQPMGGGKNIENWRKMKGTFTVPSDVDEIIVCLYMGGDGTSQNARAWFTDVNLVEGNLCEKWSPHPSEVYSGITEIDKDGITVTSTNAHSKTEMTANGFAIVRTDNNNDIFRVNSNGKLNLNGDFKCYANGENQTGNYLHQSGAIHRGYLEGWNQPVFSSGIWKPDGVNDVGYVSVGWSNSDHVDSNGCLWMSPRVKGGASLHYGQLRNGTGVNSGIDYFTDGTVQYSSFMYDKTEFGNTSHIFDGGISSYTIKSNFIDCSGSVRCDSTIYSNTKYLYLSSGGYSPKYFLQLRSDGYFYPQGAVQLGTTNNPFYKLVCTNAPNVVSDARKKENIKYINVATMELDEDDTLTIRDMYDYVKDIKLATYHMKDSRLKDENKVEIGFIAQDVVDTKVGKYIVDNSDEDNLVYDMANRISVLEGALQVAINKIEQLESLIK